MELQCLHTTHQVQFVPTNCVDASAALFRCSACRFARRNSARLSDSERQLWREGDDGWGLWAATGLILAYTCLLAWQVGGCTAAGGCKQKNKLSSELLLRCCCLALGSNSAAARTAGAATPPSTAGAHLLVCLEQRAAPGLASRRQPLGGSNANLWLSQPTHMISL